MKCCSLSEPWEASLEEDGAGWGNMEIYKQSVQKAMWGNANRGSWEGNIKIRERFQLLTCTAGGHLQVDLDRWQQSCMLPVICIDSIHLLEARDIVHLSSRQWCWKLNCFSLALQPGEIRRKKIWHSNVHFYSFFLLYSWYKKANTPTPPVYFGSLKWEPANCI